MPTLTTMTFTAGGLQRTAVVWKPAGTNLPIVFAFHGHDGTAAGFASNKKFETYWSDAIIVYPQGLVTKTGGGVCSGTGWQRSVGEVNCVNGVTDWDLKFYDVMLTTFAGSYDPSKVFIHGWSNGGEFTYDALWVARASTITAMCCAAALLNTTSGKATRPVMHIAGLTDTTVPFNQQQTKFTTILTLDSCDPTGNVWAVAAGGVSADKFVSSVGKDCVFLEYNGGHAYPDDTVPPIIIQFFQTVGAAPAIFLSQTEMTPSGGQVYDEFYWFNSGSASLTYANGIFPLTGSYRFDLSAYAVAGTPVINVFLDNILQGSVSVTGTAIQIYSLFISNVTLGVHSIKIQLSNFSSGTNHGRVGLLYFTQTSQTTPPVFPVVAPNNVILGQMLTKESYASTHLRGFNLGSNGYNVPDAQGGTVQSMIDMKATGANIARCFVEIYRPNSPCEGGSSTADDYAFKAGELTKLATTVSRAQTLGLFVVPCIFLDPCYNTDYWGNDARKASIISLWRQLAVLYNGNTTVGGYDLINEPRQNFNYAEVIKFQSAIIDASKSDRPRSCGNGGMCEIMICSP
jgi:predicted esterase